MSEEVAPLSELRRPASPSGRRRQVRRLAAFALVLASAASVGIAMATRGSTSDAVAEHVNALVSQAQKRFGDGRILSASVVGSALRVKLAAPDEPSLTNATFEGQMLGHAVRDWLIANDDPPIDTVVYLDSNGDPLPGSQESDQVTGDPSLAALGSDACASAAQAAQAEQTKLTGSSLRVSSSMMLPYDGGACLVEFQTSDADAFASNAPLTVAKFVNALGDPNERPYFLEVTDESGTPQFLASFVPGGGGQAYIRPGLSTVFEAGGQVAQG